MAGGCSFWPQERSSGLPDGFTRPDALFPETPLSLNSIIYALVHIWDPIIYFKVYSLSKGCCSPWVAYLFERAG